MNGKNDHHSKRAAGSPHGWERALKKLLKRVEKSIHTTTDFGRYQMQSFRGQMFQGERMTAALLDRLTHHCGMFEINRESVRFRESMKEQKKCQRSRLIMQPTAAITDKHKFTQISVNCQSVFIRVHLWFKRSFSR